MALLALSDEERMLRETAQDFCRQRTPVEQLRRLRDCGSETQYEPEVWREMAEMGWAAVPWPEALGGLGAGYRMLGVITEETGKTLTASPLFATAWIGGTALSLSGNETVRDELMPKVSAGKALIALALEEGNHHGPQRIATRARREGDGYLLSGHKSFVIDGHIADYLIVVARTSGERDDRDGISLFLVPGGSDGIGRTRLSTVDSRGAAAIELLDVRVDERMLLGPLGKGADFLDRVLDIARIGLASEMLGTAQECFDRSVAFLKERTQFGVPIGSFQALKHRAAKLFCDIELSRSCVMAALTALDDSTDTQQLSLLASAAKAKVGETLHDVACEAVQFHGGFGMTDESEIGFFLKRSAVVDQMFGDAHFHRLRFATISASQYARGEYSHNEVLP